MNRRSPHLLLLPLLALLLFALPALARAAEVMPPKPNGYFNDYANVVDPPVAAELNKQLEDFERQTSNQVVVAVYPKMQSDSDPADYCTRVFNSWKIGQKGKNNGAALFVFIQDRKMQIVTGYGLEGALPDATCKQIIDNEIKPSFKTGNYNQGLRAGVTAIIAATKGEYKGTGRTANQEKINWNDMIFSALLLCVIAAFIIGGMARGISGSLYDGQRGASRLSWFLYYLAMMAPRGGGSWSGGSGGGSWGGGGGGFSGGGGSSGGGGAGGSW